MRLQLACMLPHQGLHLLHVLLPLRRQCLFVRSPLAFQRLHVCLPLILKRLRLHSQPVFLRQACLQLEPQTLEVRKDWRENLHTYLWLEAREVPLDQVLPPVSMRSLELHERAPERLLRVQSPGDLALFRDVAVRVGTAIGQAPPAESGFALRSRATQGEATIEVLEGLGAPRALQH